MQWTASPSARDARHLEVFLDEYAAKIGYIVCRVQRPTKLTARVTAVPWFETPNLVG